MRRFAEIDSTNRYLGDQAAQGAREGLVAVADYQTHGKGRLGRRWEAPPGTNLLVSVLLEPSLAEPAMHLVTVVAGLAAADACKQTAGVEPGLKWPNDLYATGRKLAGILAERRERVVVVGVGLNVRWPPPESDAADLPVPPELATAATSLWRESAESAEPRCPEPSEVLAALLSALERGLCELESPGGAERVAAEYRRRCVTIGKQVKVSLVGSSVEGVAVDITEEGHLVVDSGGTQVTISAGDVVHLE